MPEIRLDLSFFLFFVTLQSPPAFIDSITRRGKGLPVFQGARKIYKKANAGGKRKKKASREGQTAGSCYPVTQKRTKQEKGYETRASKSALKSFTLSKQGGKTERVKNQAVARRIYASIHKCSKPD